VLHLHHPKPTTPTTSIFRPQILQRSSSHHGAQSGSWGPSYVVPKSARKWARTAHLHEVKTPAALGSGSLGSGSGSGGRGSLTSSPKSNHDRTPREFASGKDRDKENDFFSMASKYKTNGNGGLSEGSLLLRPEDDGDGDLWVDTDSIDGLSEVDSAVDQSTNSPRDDTVKLVPFPPST